MRPIVMKGSLGPPLTESDIAALEEQLGISLPSDYKAFLHHHNGGHPEPSVFRVYDKEPEDGSSPYPKYTERVVAFFLGKSQDEYNDLLGSAKLAEDRVPPELLPVGRDVFGNLICLAVSGPNRGKIYLWFHEEEVDEGEPPTYSNVYFVANNFRELLDSLTDFREGS